ncbi:GntR family transcriptional regulator [Anaerostipes caccae]|uniref:UbiC transcription regulator-associated domain protein n=2 Tax=Anaerostipes caccae TaxID=105841 RepID=B0MI92_ANACD|nr:GntR family transcriptional regulator [Anaerostipes caccae]EDR96016.1 UbiC transcription regulator-associated domain protein [Anaerostipes caccae L1-92]
MAPNEKLPSERDLIEEFGFSRPTIQKALSDLENEGIIYRRPRQGSFVSERRLHKSLDSLQSFPEDLRSSGDVPSTRLIAFEIIEASETVARKLHLKTGDPVYYLVRLRHKNGDPIIYDYSYYAPFAIQDASCEVFVDSIYSFMEQRGMKISMAEKTVDAILPPKEIAEALKLRDDEPVIKIEMVAYLSDGRPFEYTLSHKNPKKYLLEIKSYR